MKTWTQGCRFSLRTRKFSKTRGNVHFFMIVFIFFFIFHARGTWNPGKPWKSMKNTGKQSKTRKMKKQWQFGLKVADSHPEPGNLQKPEEIFICLPFFNHFPCPWHLKSRKTMKINEKTMENHQKQRKMKKKWSCKLQMEKNMKIWTQSCRFSLRSRNLQKLEKNFIFKNHVLIIFFIFRARVTWNPGKPWKSMKNNGKPSKTKENEKT